MSDDVGAALAEIDAPGHFAVRRQVPADDLQLEVRGVGPVSLPVTEAQARALCTVARPARYGRGERTLRDPSVRDGHVVAKSRVKVDRRRWNPILRAELERIRHELGLPEGCRLEAELHDLLVYGPGQFFLPHQDAEKRDDMIGSLVVLLPSAFSGGSLVVRHHDERMTVRGSRSKLSLVAFYADCEHEVRPVRSGYRVALTYHLSAKGRARPAAPPPGASERLADAVRAHFETPTPPRWHGDAPGSPPDRLVYLLDHQYTRRGLRWERLKNADAWRGSALREAARRLDCEAVLAQAEVHETWSCIDADWDWRRGRRGDRAFGEPFDDLDDAPADLELLDLIDDDIVLRHWVGAGRPLAGASSRVAHGELRYTKPSGDLEPLESEYTPYMGNWGNTLDRWYHRAAIVLWPRERDFAVRARESARWAIGKVRATLDSGAAENARAMLDRLRPFWPAHVRLDDGDALAEPALAVAAGLEDAELAAELLAPLALEQLSPDAAPQLLALLERYGRRWCEARLEEWSRERPMRDRTAWLPSLPALCRPLVEQGGRDGARLVRRLAAEQWRWLEDRSRSIVAGVRPSEMLDALASLHPAILALLETSRIAGDDDLRAGILQALRAPEIRGPARNAARLVRRAHEVYPPSDLRALGLDALAGDTMQALAAKLAEPARAKGDWSVPTPRGCGCELCERLSAFLAAPDQRRLEWPIAKAKRAHVHQVIEHAELPLDHATRRSGRPYTLVLEKTPALFERETAERAACERELEWLRS